MPYLEDVIYLPPPLFAAGSPYMEYTQFSDATFSKYLQVLCHIFNCFIYLRIHGMQTEAVDIFSDAYA
jgi:hypothetical protein